jgi:hypothetical protein
MSVDFLVMIPSLISSLVLMIRYMVCCSALYSSSVSFAAQYALLALNLHLLFLQACLIST